MTRLRYALTALLATTMLGTATAALAEPAAPATSATSAAAARPALRAVGQQVSLSAPAQVVQRERVQAVVKVRPGQRGRTVVLQERGARGWSKLAAAKTSRKGRVAFTVPTRKAREAVLRAKVRAFKGQRAMSSAVVATVVVTSEVPTVSVDGDDAGLRGTVTLSGTTAGSGDSVRVLVDGVEVAQSASVSGRWSVEWDSTTVADGPHEVVVRGGGTTGRLSPGLPITLANDDAEPDAGLPAGFRLETVASGFTLPTAVTVLTSGSALVAEKGGVVKLVRDGRVVSKPVIDLSDEVLTDGDMGLIGMTVAPDFDRPSATGDLFLAYTYKEAGWSSGWPGLNTQRVVRFSMNDGVADPGTGQVLLGGLPARACDTDAEMTTPGCMPTVGAGHTVDDLLFDSAGRLLVSVGDSTIFWGVTDEGKRAQNPDVLVGKILRIDPDTGLGVPANPWYEPGTDARNRSRVLALGLRNPFRIARHPVSGSVYVGDVGGAYTEEINVVTPGANYGWPCYEGTAKQLPGSSFCSQMHSRVDSGALTVTAPVHSYPHTGSGGSLSLGAFYEGGEYPASYDNRLFFGDYAQSFVRTLRFDGDVAQGAPTEFMAPSATGGPVDFAMGPDGRIWYLAIMTGELRRIRYDDGCATGEFEASYFTNETLAGPPVWQTCESEVGGDWGTGAPSVGVDADHFSARWRGRVDMPGGTYDMTGAASSGGVRVWVDDELVVDAWTTGGSGSNVVRLDAGVHDIVVEYRHTTGAAAASLTYQRQGTAPTVGILSPYNGLTVHQGTVVGWTAQASDKQDAKLPRSAVSVLVETLHYTDDLHFHAHPEAEVSGTTGSVRISDEHAPGLQAFRLTASATDSSGWRGQSTSVYVCIKDNRVGPCA